MKLEDAMETLLDLSADEVGKYAISPKVVKMHLRENASVPKTGEPRWITGFPMWHIFMI
mgnify:FL=1